MQRILIVDDDNELYSLLEEYLVAEGFSCAHAPLPEKGLTMLEGGSFNAIILDVMLPGMSGFEVLSQIRRTQEVRHLPVLMLTARAEEVDRVVGLEMGADDYLAKPFSPRELVARLRALLRRSDLSGHITANSVTQIEDVKINHVAMSIMINGVPADLTVAEMRLFSLLTASIGEVVDREDLYHKIFGHQAYPADRSLDMLVSRLRKKLGPRPDGGERIKAVRGEGYMYLVAGNAS